MAGYCEFLFDYGSEASVREDVCGQGRHGGRAVGAGVARRCIGKAMSESKMRLESLILKDRPGERGWQTATAVRDNAGHGAGCAGGCICKCKCEGGSAFRLTFSNDRRKVVTGMI